MTFRRKTRSQRIADSILKRIERDVRLPNTPVKKDKWRVVATSHDFSVGLSYLDGGPEERLTVELRRVA